MLSACEQRVAVIHYQVTAQFYVIYDAQVCCKRERPVAAGCHRPGRARVCWQSVQQGKMSLAETVTLGALQLAGLKAALHVHECSTAMQPFFWITLRLLTLGNSASL